MEDLIVLVRAYYYKASSFSLKVFNFYGNGLLLPNCLRRVSSWQDALVGRHFLLRKKSNKTADFWSDLNWDLRLLEARIILCHT